ncbi:MAG: universal stress protein [Deltaproteobacteria bacterium]|nr:universal stress protein [Deltaproteobacteria bacterium]
MIEYPKYKKVLFCTDFSENADYAFEFACGIAKRDEGVLYMQRIL